MFLDLSTSATSLGHHYLEYTSILPGLTPNPPVIFYSAAKSYLSKTQSEQVHFCWKPSNCSQDKDFQTWHICFSPFSKCLSFSFTSHFLDHLFPYTSQPNQVQVLYMQFSKSANVFSCLRALVQAGPSIWVGFPSFVITQHPEHWPASLHLYILSSFSSGTWRTSYYSYASTYPNICNSRYSVTICWMNE